MRLSRLLLTVVAGAALVGVAYVGQTNESAGAKMAAAAEDFLQSLQADQKTKATFAFDDKERLNWNFVPLQTRDRKPTRKGLPLEEMTADQRKAALALVRAGTSPDGYTKATTIMSLEAILNELEKGGAMVRNPGWYFFGVFGTPSKTGKWGWRVEGHHLSLNFTLDGGKVIGATPAFFGANPAKIMQGPRKGYRTLPEAEDLARELFASLDQEQQMAALKKDLFKGKDIEQAQAVPRVGPPIGLAAANMTDKQKTVLRKLLEAYTTRMPAEVAEVELKHVQEAGLDKIHFAYDGSGKADQPHTYRVQGPTFVVEFLNVQADSARNPANHIHSCWRNLQGDFGLASN